MHKNLSFRWGDEKHIKISEVGHKDSLFYEAYRQALAGVLDIIHDNKSVLSAQFYNFPNNMVVFCGGRGTGKSSAMMTFADSLTNKKSGMFQKDFLQDMMEVELPGFSPRQQENLLNTLQSSVFYTLPPIDPTILEDESQILTLILSRIYQMFFEAWEECGVSGGKRRDSARDNNEKNDILLLFQQCFDHITAIKDWKNKRDSYDSLEILERLGDSTNLKNDLTKLIETVLKYCPGEEGERYLVLQIDDTDLNIRQSYHILEDLRKYLVIPGVIILMAADLEHLTQVVEQSFQRDGGAENLRNIANQYISKLLPQSRQVRLPQLDTYLKEHLDSIRISYAMEVKGNGNDADSKPVLPDGSEDFPGEQQQILRLIYRKTGIIFLPRPNESHYIIPDNMRLLGSFLSVLGQMSDVADPDEEEPMLFPNAKADMDAYRQNIKNRLDNVQRFRDYFMGTWAENNLSSRSMVFLNSIARENLTEKIPLVCSNYALPAPPTYDGLMCAYNSDDADLYEPKLHKERFAIHTYFSLLGHTIVLETLYETYGGAKKPTRNDCGCSFPKLYPLFGSRIISYLPLSDIETDVARERPPIYADVASSLEGTSVKALPVLWLPLLPKQDQNTMLSAQTNVLAYLHSMLSDAWNADADWADLCSPMVNCLYLGNDCMLSPSAQSRLGTKASALQELSGAEWKKMKVNALMVLLNWDVQWHLARTARSRVLSKSDVSIPPENLVNHEELIPFYEDYYRALEAQAGGGKERKNIIRCLNKLSLSLWLKPLKNLSVINGKNLELYQYLFPQEPKEEENRGNTAKQPSGSVSDDPAGDSVR